MSETTYKAKHRGKANIAIANAVTIKKKKIFFD